MCVYIYIDIIFFQIHPHMHPHSQNILLLLSRRFSYFASAVHRVAFQMQCIINS